MQCCLLASKTTHYHHHQQQQQDNNVKEIQVVEHSPPRTLKLFRPYLDTDNSPERCTRSKDDEVGLVESQVTTEVF